MACGCSGSALREEMVRLANTQPVKGIYTLATYPDCTTTHRGKYQGLTIYMVGRNTPDERLFNHWQLAEASSYSKSTNRLIEAKATGDICDQAVIDTFAGH